MNTLHELAVHQFKGGSQALMTLDQCVKCISQPFLVKLAVQFEHHGHIVACPGIFKLLHNIDSLLNGGDGIGLHNRSGYDISLRCLRWFRIHQP
ncbi:hypothetical protein D3C77_329080 [compost metagenome]